MAIGKKQLLPQYKKFTERLKKARIEAGLTQVEAGKKLKQPQAFISKIERGERSVDALEIAEIGKVYGKSTEYFTGK